MDRLLARLERRFGRFAIPGLTNYVVGGMAIVFLLWMTRPEIVGALFLEPHLVAQGQVWRLVTYLFIPTSTSTIWVLFSLYWVWLVGSNLETEWGSFKLTAYYGLGMLGTTVAAIVTGGAQGNQFLNLSLFLAFATEFPEYEILLFFILPVRMKWLGWVSFAYVAYQFVYGDWGLRAAVIASLANYLVFFWPTIARTLRGGARAAAGPPGRRGPSTPPPPKLGRVCALCGAKEDDGADIRVCSCEKCRAATGGGARELCLAHARDH
jgi:hypothetical protein